MTRWKTPVKCIREGLAHLGLHDLPQDRAHVEEQQGVGGSWSRKSLEEGSDGQVGERTKVHHRAQDATITAASRPRAGV